MGLWPTHRDESALLRFIDLKRVTSRLSTEGSTVITITELSCLPELQAFKQSRYLTAQIDGR